MPAEPVLDEIGAALDAHGFILRSGFRFGPGEEAPPGPSGRPALSLLLIGQAGNAPWAHFKSWRTKHPAALDDPFDRFAGEAISSVAQRFEAAPVFPHARPFLPFQQWAMRAEGLKPSPLGILMHPRFGLWHAYRGALLFDQELAIPEPRTPLHLCDACIGKPCLKACPVDAHSGAGFAYAACLTHVREDVGKACMATGCLDRNACPEGQAYRYPAEMQAFHMAAFAGPARQRSPVSPT